MDLYFEDIALGQIFESGRRTVTADEIRRFAEEFDASPFHHDEEAARAAGYPSIIASGMHTLSLSMKLFFDLRLWDNAVLPSPGLGKVRWLRPLCPGDTIWIRATVTELLPSRTRPEQGVLRMQHETFNAESKPVMVAESMHRLRTRASLQDSSAG